MSKDIFLSEEHQQIFDRQGFIVLDFLEEDKVLYLNQLFDRLHPNLNNSGFYSGSYSDDIQYKKTASDEIVKVFSKAYQKYFKNYTPFGGAFLFKVPGVNSDLAIHQDWTIVNEEEYVALNCWVALNDINEENGALHIVPGTHYNTIKSLRCPTIPFFFTGNDYLLEQSGIPMYVKAGQAVILNQSVVHYSVPNNSSSIRKAITAGIKSEGAQMYFHYKVPEQDQLEVFEMDDDFLISFKNFAKDIHERPYLGKSVGFKNYESPIMTQEKLIDMIEQVTQLAGYPYKYEGPKKGSFWSNLFKKMVKG